MDVKKCYKCGLNKPKKEFGISRSVKDGLQSCCKKCKSIIDKKYREKNRDYFINYMNNYYEENRDELIRKSIIAHKKRLKKDKLYKYRESSRQKIRFRLNKILDNKEFDYCDFIGCDSKTFKNHLTQFFNDKINFDNREDWELDHIIPLYKAKTIEEINKLSHYSNIQILTRKENKTKYFNNLQKD